MMVLRWVLFCLVCAVGTAQTVPVLMLSDLHFDPLHDPAKADRLVAAPVSQWAPILSEPDSALQAERFALLQTSCNAKGVDTDYALLTSSVRAAQVQARGAQFVTVTGDVLVHDFDCRFRLSAHGGDFAEFAEKTTNFVLQTLVGAFPVPVYFAPGNNDSSCGDYRSDLGDRYRKATSAGVMAGLRGAAPAELSRARTDYEAVGSYGVTLRAPRRMRLLVLDDVFLSDKYEGCSGKTDEAAATAGLAWLEGELAAARKQRQAVWVMGHIPPGVNAYATLSKLRNVCTSGATTMFLGSDRLNDLLTGYADVVRLGLFGHTHSDELRLLRGAGGEVPVKLVASISPVHGNRPTFTVAQVDGRTAKLVDYAVWIASNDTGKNTTWEREYDFRETYQEPDFSAAAVGDLIRRLQADSGGATTAGRTYARYFTPGMLPLLRLVWTDYACSFDNLTEAGFKACVCKK